jgi:hypothetical protein
MNIRKAVVLTGTLCTAFVAGAGTAFAIDSAFGGTWQLDVAKSTFAGDPLTFAALPGGKVRFSSGQTIAYVFACDGKAYKTISDSSVSCARVSPLVYRFTYVNGGKTTGIETDTLAADGKTFTSVEVHPLERGSSTTKRYTRIGNGAGLIGTWTTPGDPNRKPKLLTITATAKSVSLTMNGGASLTIPLDGSKFVFTGPGVPKDAYIVGKALGNDEVDFTQMLGSRDIGESMWQLGKDRKTLVWTSWRPGARNNPTIAVYAKQ